MRIVIAGGSGFLGRALTHALTSAGHHVQILTRKAVSVDTDAAGPVVERIAWSPDGGVGPWASRCDGADVIINLAGESIAAQRWSSARKAQLLASRLLPTRSVVTFVEGAARRPTLVISSSAIGCYGDRGDEVLTEHSPDGAGGAGGGSHARGPRADADRAPVGSGFLADLCSQWEREAARARSDRTRVVLLRTGIVLDPAEGALAKMLPPFRLFAGGPFGSGRQVMSWIHRDDWVSLVVWVAGSPSLDGPVNATAPNPVTNAEFARALGRVLKRPAFIPAPAFALRLLLGEMAQALLLSSQRVLPSRALEGGFRFRYEIVDDALTGLLG